MFSVEALWSALTPGSVLTMNEAATIERSVASVITHKQNEPLWTQVEGLCASAAASLENVVKHFSENKLKTIVRLDKTPREDRGKWKTRRRYHVVGFVVAQISRLCLLLNHGPFPSLRFVALNSLLPRQGEQTWYTVIPQGLWDYLFTATLTEAEPLGSSTVTVSQHGKHAEMHASNIVTKNNRQTWWTMSKPPPNF